jgi:hypothetical protein
MTARAKTARDLGSPHDSWCCKGLPNWPVKRGAGTAPRAMTTGIYDGTQPGTRCDRRDSADRIGLTWAISDPDEG